MAGRWTADDMYALGTHHAKVEAEGNLEATMATLVGEPVYEFLPLGLRMVGHLNVRRYYKHLLSEFVPRTRGYELLEEWVNETSVSQEYAIDVAVDGQIERHRVIGILYAEGGLLGGERIYSSERCARLMAGDALIDELLPR
jgi:hypothetical protein